MVSCSHEVFITGVDDEKLMACLEECDVNSDELISDNRFSSDSRTGYAPKILVSKEEAVKP